MPAKEKWRPLGAERAVSAAYRPADESEKPARCHPSGQPEMDAINAPAGFLAPRRYVTEGPDEKGSLSWVEVNAVTWKLTDGALSRTPACHGKWGSFATERALVWVIDGGWPFGKACWYVRRGDKSYRPTSLSTAKQAARALLTGAPLPKDDNAKLFNGPVDLNRAALMASNTDNASLTEPPTKEDDND